MAIVSIQRLGVSEGYASFLAGSDRDQAQWQLEAELAEFETLSSFQSGHGYSASYLNRTHLIWLYRILYANVHSEHSGAV